jgi:hypothetical protein
MSAAGRLETASPTLVDLLRRLDEAADEAIRAASDLIVAGAHEIAIGIGGAARPATARIRWQQAMVLRSRLYGELRERLEQIDREAAK